MVLPTIPVPVTVSSLEVPRDIFGRRIDNPRSSISLPPTTTTTYQYRPLESGTHIRILYLDPLVASDNQPLSGSIVHVSLQDEPIYDALSYYWGPSDFCREIIIDGCKLAITANLESALRCVRRRIEYYNSQGQPIGRIPIWADGVCIKQQDDDEGERNHQVRLMSQIYSDCRTGVVYLGEQADGSGNIKLIELAVNGYYQRYARQFKLQDWTQTFAGLKEETLTDDELEGWRCLGALLCRPWFRRIWVVQEFALPRRIRMMCGTWEVAGSLIPNIALMSYAWEQSPTVMRALHSYTKGQRVQAANHRFLFEARMSLGHSDELMFGKKKSEQNLSLLTLLFGTRRCKASDRRDRFFALLSLASDVKDGSTLAADYSKTFEEVEMDFARHLVNDGYGLSLLNFAGLASNSPAGYPTWLPDWTGRFSKTPHLIWEQRLDKQPAQVHLAPDRQSLLVEGCCIGVVQAMSSPAPNDITQLTNWIGEEVGTMAAKSRSYPFGVETEEATWRTLVADKSAFGARPAPEEYKLTYRRCRRLASASSDLSGHVNKGTLNVDNQFFHVVTGDKRVRERFCITTGGMFGLVPGNAEVGDLIVVIKGDERQAKGMYTLRKNVDGDARDPSYTWLGHAYVHDVWKVKQYKELEDWAIFRVR